MRTIKQKALATVAAIAKDFDCEAVLNDLAPRGEHQILVQRGWETVATVTLVLSGTGTSVYIASPGLATAPHGTEWRANATRGNLHRSLSWSDGAEVDKTFSFIHKVLDRATKTVRSA